MKLVKQYENQKVLVLGLARSGVSAAKLLHELGAFVTVNDFKPFEENPEAQELLQLGIRVITGSHPVELLDEEFRCMIKNPGIPYTNPMVQEAEKKGIPILTEVELAYQIAECPIVGITGTNGKTTTTTMIAEILNQGRIKGKARLAGNIGLPASEVAQEAQPEDELIVELSSFQLMGIETFRPKIAVITNLYEAHLDYHGSRKAYVTAKWQIQRNMTQNDWLILNWDQAELRELAQQTEATVIPFSAHSFLPEGVSIKEHQIFFCEDYIMETTDIGIPGLHNVENALATIAVACLKNVSIDHIREALQSFSGVPHRTQYVETWQGRQFYNDSKATNILATRKAIEGFEARKLILLAGGLDRGNEFDELLASFKDIKGIVLFGETKYKLEKIAKEAGIPDIRLVENVTESVSAAYQISNQGDTILLSPACASWDQYANFEIRGNQFVSAIQRLKKEVEE